MIVICKLLANNIRRERLFGEAGSQDYRELTFTVRGIRAFMTIEANNQTRSPQGDESGPIEALIRCMIIIIKCWNMARVFYNPNGVDTGRPSVKVEISLRCNEYLYRYIAR